MSTPTREELLAMSNTELVELWNRKALGPELSSWKRKKELLVDRILEGFEAIEPEPEPEPKSERTIRVAALELMCQVEYYEDKTKKSGPDNVVDEGHKNARSVGLPYLEIIRRIKEEFPEAQTSVACLRWYGVKARVEEFGYEGYRLVQRRPRASGKK